MGYDVHIIHSTELRMIKFNVQDQSNGSTKRGLAGQSQSTPDFWNSTILCATTSGTQCASGLRCFPKPKLYFSAATQWGAPLRYYQPSIFLSMVSFQIFQVIKNLIFSFVHKLAFWSKDRYFLKNHQTQAIQAKISHSATPPKVFTSITGKLENCYPPKEHQAQCLKYGRIFNFC